METKELKDMGRRDEEVDGAEDTAAQEAPESAAQSGSESRARPGKKLSINKETIRALEDGSEGDATARVTIVIRCASDNTDCCQPDPG